MIDPRVKKLAKILVDYSVYIKKGDNVIISSSPEASPLIKEVYANRYVGHLLLEKYDEREYQDIPKHEKRLVVLLPVPACNTGN